MPASSIVPALHAGVPPLLSLEAEAVLGDDETAQTLSCHAYALPALDAVSVLCVDAVAAPYNLNVSHYTITLPRSSFLRLHFSISKAISVSPP